MAKDRPFRLGATYTPIPKRSCSCSHLFTPCFFLWDSLNLYIECMADESWACLPEIAFYI
ncbi:hypothetical protein F9B82_08925 [Lacticaseibacillus casei]|nr:hypothetical protein F9B82_08925 [Lacticaseibacillus casei]